MPTENRVLYVRAKVRREFEAHRDERNHEKIAFLVSLGETQLDQVGAHAEHLTKVFSDPGVHAARLAAREMMEASARRRRAQPTKESEKKCAARARRRERRCPGAGVGPARITAGRRARWRTGPNTRRRVARRERRKEGAEA